MKKSKSKIEGLHLWLVTSPDYTYNLWITTNRNSILFATNKAQAWLRRNVGVKAPRITNVSNKGTLDA